MSTVDADVSGPGTAERGPEPELTVARVARVGDLEVRRLMPLRRRRTVGAWCFVDHYGPMSVDGVAGMQVPPHPHIGLQTVTWLLAGNVLHRDSLGSEQMIRPGQLNLMTAGRGIAHSEESPAEHDPHLHGVQLWVALPDAARLTEPAFEHHAQLPDARIGGFEITVFVGSLGGAQSPARMFSDIIGAELVAAADARARLPLEPAHEHVIFVATGSAEVEGTVLRPGHLLYLGTGRDRALVAAARDSRLFLLGGIPLGERLLMWWNFVARTPEEIAAAAGDWQQGRFDTVGGYRGAPLPAPPLDITRLRRPTR
ncbi:MAG TPA: pirin family protein [Streptosporangiaceae bacterium]|nr:pirin family protein [Streptosporangiaceae bacterium]